MEAVGFRHFARLSPNRLALAAPDGRHWSRGELWAECERLIHTRPARAHEPAISVPNCAGLIAGSLAFEYESNTADALDPPQEVEKARRLMEPFSIQPEQDNVHYCALPLDCEEKLVWALASLHFGHSVVLADHWDANNLLQDIEHYRITTCCLSAAQADDLLSLPEEARHFYDTASMQQLIPIGTPYSPAVGRALADWWGGALQAVFDPTPDKITPHKSRVSV